jgi:hypothetical protein
VITRWVRFWDRREHPRVLGLLRIGVASVLLYDLLYLWALGLVQPLFAAREHGGLSLALSSKSPPLVTAWLGGGPEVATALHTAMVLAAVSLLMGFFTRTSAWVLLLLSAQHALILPWADRGIDMLLRNVLMILGLSAAGRWMSLDAWWTTGRWTGDGEPAPAWPRYLMILQLVVMYFTAGVQKYAMHWWPWGEWSSLYVVLHDWAYARFDLRELLRHTLPYRFTQLSTAITMAYQLSYPAVLWLFWLQEHPERGGRLGRWAVRNHLELVWIGLGAIFHLGIFATMQLGIFPSAMLVTYVVFWTPAQWERLLRR